MHVLVYYKGETPTVLYQIAGEDVYIECPDMESAIRIGKTIACEKGLPIKIEKPN